MKKTIIVTVFAFAVLIVALCPVIAQRRAAPEPIIQLDDRYAVKLGDALAILKQCSPAGYRFVIQNAASIQVIDTRSTPGLVGYGAQDGTIELSEYLFTQPDVLGVSLQWALVRAARHVWQFGQPEWADDTAHHLDNPAAENRIQRDAERFTNQVMLGCW